MILATAVAGQATAIASGDKAGMQALGSIEGIPILTARAAALRLGLEPP